MQAGVKGGLNVCEDPVTRIEQWSWYIHVCMFVAAEWVETGSWTLAYIY